MSTHSQSGSRSWLIVVAAVLIAGLALFAGSLLARMGDSDTADSTNEIEPQVDYQVVATINPLAMIAREVTGDIVEVSSIVPSGATPHGFEPTVSDVATAQQADLILAVGGEFDAWIVSSAATDATMLELLSVQEDGHDDEDSHDHEEDKHQEDEAHAHADEHADEHEDEHADESQHDHADDREDAPQVHAEESEAEHDHAHHEDPHVWLDPYVAGQYALEIAEVLAAAMPEYASQFQDNARTFVEELEELEQDLSARVAQAELAQGQQISVITMHDAYEPFAAAFGFSIAGSYEPEPGETPSPSDIAHLKDVVEEQDVQYFVTEPQLEGVDARVTNQIACDLGVGILTFDPLGEEGQSYTDLLERNIGEIFTTVIGPGLQVDPCSEL